MDFGVGGLDGLVGLNTSFCCTDSDPETKQKMYGSGGFKQERSSNVEDDLRSLKVAKTDEFSGFEQRNSLLRSNGSGFSDGQSQQQMLSFSSPQHSETLRQSNALPYFPQTASGFCRNGYNSGSFNGGNMYGVLSGTRGPFTPSQLMELEHQALIYKYIIANVPIPSNLLIPIRKAIDSAGFSSFSSRLHRPVGWGPFHLRFSNSTDPEPGRCRRTDGKKWRCSKDAVLDQKYCERHMNRGRHRSRKPVEGQTGHSVSGITSITSNKLMPVASSSASVVSGGCASNCLGIAHEFKNLQPGTFNQLSSSTPINRMRMQDAAGLSSLSPTIDMKSEENTFFTPKQQTPFTEFGLVSSNSLFYPSRNTSTFVDDRETEAQNSLLHCIDDWPKNNSDRSALSWTELDTQSDNTQLSISISIPTPMAASEKINLSPLRLAQDFNQIPRGGQLNWIPISWETSMGGPLGEVLQNTSNNVGVCKNKSALNLMTEGWDNSPSLGSSSPTGVLQKTTLGSFSNGSAGSSPRVETNRTYKGASMCNDILGTSFVNSSSM